MKNRLVELSLFRFVKIKHMRLDCVWYSLFQMLPKLMFLSLCGLFVRMVVYTGSPGVLGDRIWQRAQEVYPQVPTIYLTTRCMRPRRSTPLHGNQSGAGAAPDATASTDTSPSVRWAYGTIARRASASQKRRKKRMMMLTGRAHHFSVCRTWTWTRPFQPRVFARLRARTHGLTAGWVGLACTAMGRAVAPSRSAPRLTTCPFKTGYPHPLTPTPATPLSPLTLPSHNQWTRDLHLGEIFLFCITDRYSKQMKYLFSFQQKLSTSYCKDFFYNGGIYM